MVRLVARGVAEEDHRGKAAFSSCPIEGTCHHRGITVDVEIDRLAQVVFVKFLHGKVTFSPCFHTLLFGIESFCIVHTQGAERRWKIYINYWEFLCPGKLFILSQLFIYSFTYLYQYGLTDIYFRLCINPILIYLLCAHIIPALTIRSFFSCLSCLFDIPHHCVWVCVCVCVCTH